MELQFRVAKSNELTALNKLIHSSISYWGYSEKFLDIFIRDWGLTEVSFNSSDVYVIECNYSAAAVIRIQHKEPESELNDFFIAPERIGKGVGKWAWDKAIELMTQQGCSSFFLVSDPNAESFL